MNGDLRTNTAYDGTAAVGVSFGGDDLERLFIEFAPGDDKG